MVMPANNAKMEVGYLAGRYPSRVGWLLGPGVWKTPKTWLPHALDNGRYGAWDKGTEWDEAAYRQLLEKAVASRIAPLWAVVPDVVTDRDATLREWDRWAPRLESMGLRLAMACQDGMTPADVPPGVVAFIGGSVAWKRRSIIPFCAALPRVHVGKINTYRWLWACHRAGAESCDGTGFFRGDQRQQAGLFRYLAESSGAGEPQRRFA